MSIKLKDLKRLFPFNKEIADILGVTRQAVDRINEFKSKSKVEKLEIASEQRMTEIRASFRAIKKDAKKILQDDSS